MEWSKEKQTPQIDHSQTREERRGAANGRRKIKQSHQGPVVHSCGTLRFPAQLLNKVSCFPGQEEPWSTKSLLQASCLQTQCSSQLSLPILPSLCCLLCHLPGPLLHQWPTVFTSTAAIGPTCLEPLAPFPHRSSFPPEALPKYCLLLLSPCWCPPAGDGQSQCIIARHPAISGHCCCLFPQFLLQRGFHPQLKLLSPNTTAVDALQPLRPLCLLPFLSPTQYHWLVSWQTSKYKFGVFNPIKYLALMIPCGNEWHWWLSFKCVFLTFLLNGESSRTLPGRCG